MKKAKQELSAVVEWEIETLYRRGASMKAIQDRVNFSLSDEDSITIGKIKKVLEKAGLREQDKY